METNQTIALPRLQERIVGAREVPPVLSMRPETNLWRDAWVRLLRNKLAIFGAVVVLFFIFLAIFANFLAPYRYDYTDFGNAYQYPSWRFPFGTDALGHDMLSRLIYG
ncbi:MAG: ABC transporter permease, partial [Chloroflexi bacterium]|nr:ABC transporter permease [Chloroflexota bacterium]